MIWFRLSVIHFVAVNEFIVKRGLTIHRFSDGGYLEQQRFGFKLLRFEDSGKTGYRVR